MSRTRRPADPADLPPLYAVVQPGLEPVAADEITRDLKGEVKKVARGLVVFRVADVTPAVLGLRTTEDVFLLAWGSDTLTHRAADLKSFRTWTANRPDWPALFKLHHAVRPLKKGKPTFHLVCQKQGEHGFRRVDALDALADGLAGKLPAGWQPVGQGAWLEVWLTIRGQTAVCGVRLSDRTMRHRTYKTEHVAASLRPSVAAAMVRLAGVGPGMTVVDPMCGAGTILAEAVDLCERRKFVGATVLGGDADPNAAFVARENLSAVGTARIARWDAVELPLESGSVDRVVSNPPFGRQLSAPDLIGPLYDRMVPEADRVLKPGGRAVYLVSEADVLRDAVGLVNWTPVRERKVRVLGAPAVLGVWQKPHRGGE